MMLVIIRTNISNADRKSSLHFRLNGELEFNFQGITPGRTQIFLVPAAQYNNINSLEVSAPRHSNLILNEIILFKEFLFEKRFVHFELLTRQIYYVNEQKGTETSNITIATGQGGTDDGVVLRLYFTQCETNVTLDTPANDFQPYSIDVFNVSLPSCGTLHCIRLYQLMSTSVWDVRNITILYRKSSRFFMNGDPNMHVKKLYCKNNVNKDVKKWTVTVYNSADITNKLTFKLVGVTGASQTHFLSENDKDSTYENRYNFISSDIGEWDTLWIVVYENITIRNGFQLMFNESRRQHMNFTALGESSTRNKHFTVPCTSYLIAADAGNYFLTTCFENNLCLYEPDLIDNSVAGLFPNVTSDWFLRITNISHDNIILNIIVNNIITSYGPSNLNRRILEIRCKIYRNNFDDRIYIRLFPGGKCDTVRIAIWWGEDYRLIPYNTQLLQTTSYCEWLIRKFPITTSETTTNEITTEQDTQPQWTKKTTSITAKPEYTKDAVITSKDENEITDVGKVTKSDVHIKTDAYYRTEDEQNNREDRTKPVVTESSIVFTSDSVKYTSTQKATQKIITPEYDSTSYKRSRADNTVAIGTISLNPLITTNTTEITITSNTRPVENASVETVCSCPCNKQPMKNLTSEEIVEKLNQLATELTIPRNTTSKYKRSKISAPDERESSLYISTFIVMIVTIPFALIIFLDLIPLIKWVFIKCM
ncbi:uncharacterized protein LOC106884345 [Octopus bimaculoides]|nr:uncharacterized protein LOC106884345 [Octopus bimaculoides]XP_052828772.1 uncharacterized protein LOC106884345 [Octopus bimaculoides]|eukprot:XP_014791170.1 PREDICTED: uncharacterized protein LOC106884345 [Octopus bimaculoides]